MQQREILFDKLTAREVAERLRVQAEINALLNAVAITVARINGARDDDRVMLNDDGTGIVILRSGDDAGGEPEKNKPRRPQTVTTDAGERRL